MTTRLMSRTSSRSTDPNTERTAPLRSAHVQLGDVPRTHDPVELRERASSARRRDDGDDEVIEVDYGGGSTTHG